MDHANTLATLEAQSIYCIREAYARIKPLAMLWSLGKDSNALLWMVRKAFLGRVPFPVILLDTGNEYDEVYAFRDRYVKEWGLNCINAECPPYAETDPSLPSKARAAARKTLGVARVIEQHGLRGIFLGIRRDEQSIRGKERIFSPRDPDGSWDFRHQPPEFWDQYHTEFPPAAHVRIHPLLSWTEIDIWRYTKQEGIPIVPLYLARNGKRFRSLGEKDIAVPVDSNAATIDELIAELETSSPPERAGRSAQTPWYEGPPLLEAFERFVPPEPLDARPLRLPVQDIYKFDERRIVAGRIVSGDLSVGDKLVFSPSGETGEIVSLERWRPDTQDTKCNDACTGENVSITLKEQVFVERGELISRADAPPKLTHTFDADLFWLGPGSLKPGESYTLKLATRLAGARVQEIRHVIDTSSLASRQVQTVNPGEMAVVTLRSAELLALDDYASSPPTGRFVLLAGYDVVGGGTIDARRYPDQRWQVQPVSQHITHVGHKITATERAVRFGHRGAVIWLTGLSGAGKSTLSMELERRLFRAGYSAYVLDGDNVRQGLNANLGFSPEDRKENIRRVGEVAALFADAGIVCITAFISPYRDDRAMAREAVKSGAFYEVHVQADLATCEQRDPKGLYSKARRGEIKGMTGIDAPYEPPESPDLIVDTATHSVDESVALLVEFVRQGVAGG